MGAVGRSFSTQHRFFTGPLGPAFIFLASSVYLSYVPATLAHKLFVFLFGIGIPFFTALRIGGPKAAKPGIFGKEEAFAVPGFFPWFLVLAGGIFFRFYHLESLSVWPLLDEGRNGYIASGLSRGWDGRFFHDISQMPPFFYWAMGLFFKVFKPSLFHLWLFPALLSALSVAAGYWAARRYFSKTFSFLLVCLLALGFYPVYVGRYAHQAVLLVFWEWIAFGLLGLYLHSKGRVKNKLAIALGIFIALGFYIYFAWLFVALGLGILLLATRHRGAGKPLFLLAGSFLLSLAPLVVAGFREGYGSYLFSLAAGNGSLGEWAYNSFSYVSGLFWGLETERHAYKPFWGGFLNPLLTACFLTGLLEILRAKSDGVARTLLMLLVLFLFPAFFSKEMEMFRVVPILPVLLVVAVFGLQRLAVNFSPNGKGVFLSGVLFLSFALDFYHLAGPYHQACVGNPRGWAAYSKSVERWRAFQILKKIYAEKGPGFLLDDFDPYPFDKSLALAAEPIALETGEGLASGKAGWVAFLTNINLKPFLARRFPKSRWVWLSEDLSTLDGGMALVVFPLDSPDEIIGKWIEANEALKPVTSLMLNRPYGENREAILKELEGIHPVFQGDPFLETLYWNLRYLNHGADRNWGEAMRDLEGMIVRGFPNAYAFNEMGSLLAAQGRTGEARKAFEEAIRAPLNLTPASENLKLLVQGLPGK